MGVRDVARRSVAPPPPRRDGAACFGLACSRAAAIHRAEDRELAFEVEALEAHRQIVEDIPGAGLLLVTSPDRLQRGWRASDKSHAEHLLNALPADAGLITVLDGHPATLSWLSAVRCQPVDRRLQVVDFE